MTEKSNVGGIYRITLPDGEVVDNVRNLRKFCSKYNLNYKGVKKTSYEGKQFKYYKKFKFEKIGTNYKSKSEYDNLSKYGLTTEEKLIKVIDDNNKLRQTLKESQKESMLFKYLNGVINENISPINLSPYIQPQKSSPITESAILMLSDIHADQEIKPHRVQNLENYNFDVACKRAERIVDTTVSHLIENMSNYQYETLYIFGLGDYVNGEIHNATEHTKWRNSIKNAMATGELMAQMINDLSRYFPQIVFISVSGNHGRRSSRKDYRGAHNNWDYFVSSYAMSRLEPLIESGRLTYSIPDSWSAGVNIYGYNFVLNHGDDIKSWNSIPFYGIERKTRRLTAIGAVTGTIPNYYAFGHFHTGTVQQHTAGEIFINGSFNATDEYALEALGAYSEPVQWLFGIHEKYGVTNRMPIRLRTPDWKNDERKRGRYNVKLIGG